MNLKQFSSSRSFNQFARILLAIGIGLTLGFIITCFVSKDPIGSYQAFLFGPLTRLNRIGDWLEESLTLVLVGLAVSIVFNGKQFYIGVEGQMLLAALTSGAVALYVPLPPILRVPLVFLVGMLTGFLWGLIPAFLKAYLNASELVTSLMMNTIATKLFEYFLKTYMVPPKIGGLYSNTVPADIQLHSFIPNLPFLSGIRSLWESQTSVSTMVYITIAAVLIAYLIIYKTPFGYELRMIGSNIKFARFGGINVPRTIVLSIAISGIFAGLAGVHLVLAIHQKVVMGMSYGLGFEGINIAILSSNNPLGVPIASLLYGYLRAGADIMERTTDVSRELVTIVQASVLLMVTAERLLPTIQKRFFPRKVNGGKIEGETDVA